MGNFFAQPFKGGSEMDTLDWFLFLGLLIVLSIIWGFILRHITETVQ